MYLLGTKWIINIKIIIIIIIRQHVSLERTKLNTTKFFKHDDFIWICICDVISRHFSFTTRIYLSQTFYTVQYSHIDFITYCNFYIYTIWFWSTLLKHISFVIHILSLNNCFLKCCTVLWNTSFSSEKKQRSLQYHPIFVRWLNIGGNCHTHIFR